MKATVVVFPGSNCDHDVIHLYSALLGAEVGCVWHRDTDLGSPDLIILPGGFSHGDYLRTGAMAKLSPVMKEVQRFAAAGGPVLGICNGFQILCEAEMLPGVLLRNVRMKFLSRFVNLRVESTATEFTKRFSQGEVISCPVAHGEGNYFADQETIARLEGEGRVVFRYCDHAGNVRADSEEFNPNGSINAIAGVANEHGNVVGLMPHPERAAEELIGYIGRAGGLRVFQ